MTVLLDLQWQDSCLLSHYSSTAKQSSKSRTFNNMKPVLRVSPDYKPPSDSLKTTTCASPTHNSNLLSPNSCAPSSTSPRSSASSFAQKIHVRMRSLSGAKAPLSARQRWERLCDADKDRSARFVRDAVSMCGLAGYSWKKTYDYLQLATELPLDPRYVLDADFVPPQPPSESTSRLGSLLDRKPSANSLLTPDSTSRRSSVSRPETASSVTSTSSVAVPEPDIKPILTAIRLLFEEMQTSRHPLYLHYVDMPDNNLKKMHENTVAAHRVATLKKERSSLMDAIEFDRSAEKARGMEMAVAKLRFEMELSIPNAAVDTQLVSPNPKNAAMSKTSTSTTSASQLPRQQKQTNMRSAAAGNNRISGAPTVITTVSDMSHFRHLSMASSIDRPDSPASARSEGHVHTTDTWRRLQEAKARLSRRSKSRTDGVRTPGSAQRVDENGFFGRRPTDLSVTSNESIAP